MPPRFLMSTLRRRLRRGPPARDPHEAGSVFLRGRAVADSHRQLRRRPRAGGGRRLDRRSDRGEARREAGADGACRRGAARRRGGQLQHVGHPDRVDRGGAVRQLPPSLARHALLQPAALSASARAISKARHRHGRRRRRSEFADRRSAGVVARRTRRGHRQPDRIHG